MKELQEKNSQEKEEVVLKTQESRKDTEHNGPSHSKHEESVPSQQVMAKSLEPDKTGTPVDLKNNDSIERRLDSLQREKLTEVYNESGEVLASYNLTETYEGLSNITSAFAILTGGVVSQRMVDAAHEHGIRQIYGIKVSNLTKKPVDLKVVEWDHRS